MPEPWHAHTSINQHHTQSNLHPHPTPPHPPHPAPPRPTPDLAVGGGHHPGLEAVAIDHLREGSGGEGRSTCGTQAQSCLEAGRGLPACMACMPCHVMSLPLPRLPAAHLLLAAALRPGGRGVGAGAWGGSWGAGARTAGRLEVVAAAAGCRRTWRCRCREREQNGWGCKQDAGGHQPWLAAARAATLRGQAGKCSVAQVAGAPVHEQ